MLKNYSIVYADTVHPDACRLITRIADWKKEKDAEVTTGKNINHDIRRTDIVFENTLSLAGCILQSYIKDANIRGEWNFDLLAPETVQIGRYESGGHYDWHSDMMAPTEQGLVRKLTGILFLSDPDAYEGGDFELQADYNVPKHPSKGSIVVFPSMLNHRVTPITSGIRYTAVCWFLGAPFK